MLTLFDYYLISLSKNLSWSEHNEICDYKVDNERYFKIMNYF